jgi:hypothetical protein
VTRNTIGGHFVYAIWNEYNLNTLTRNNWRASLVPAAAVIPAPIVYIKVAAVKKLVVGFREFQIKARPCGVARFGLPIIG